MDEYQRFALNQYLCDYRDDVTYTDVLRMVQERSDEVVVWEPFEDYPPESITKFIDSLVDSLRRTFIPR